jgi:predicted DsbA family dithiol-disulfide isomerase
MGGNLGNSFDAQRLILLARKQGKENACIEAIYKANHEDGRCLSDVSVLVGAAEQAGVSGVRDMLGTQEGVAEVRHTINRYVEMGVSAVPVIIINEKYTIYGFPDAEMLERAFSELLDTGRILCIPP